jgi:hypothetical protein
MRANTRGVDRRLAALILLATLLGLGHHIDHLIRGNHVGWPVTSEVNAFTYSLGIYPVIMVGFYLTIRDHVGPRYWVIVASVGLGMLAAVHLGPWALEPPRDIISPYQPGTLGYVAFAWLLALLGSLLVAALYALRQWRSPDQSRSAE